LTYIFTKAKSKSGISLICFFIATHFFYLNVSFAQNLSLDTVPNTYTHSILEAEKIRLSDPNEFSKQLKLLRLGISEMTSYQKCHLEYLNSYELAYSGQLKKAKGILQKSINDCNDLKVKVRMFGFLANLNIISGQFDKASYYIDLAVRNIEHINDQTTISLVYSAASIVYENLKQYELSANYSKLLYNIIPTQENLCKSNYFDLLNQFNLNDSFNQSGDVDEAIEGCVTSGNALYTIFIRIRYVEYRLDSRELNKSILEQIKNELIDIEEEVIATNYKSAKAQYYAVLADVYLDMYEYDNAQKNANNSLEVDFLSQFSEHQIRALNVLEKIALNSQNFKVSYDFLNLKNEAELKMYDQSQTKQMAFMAVKHSNLAKVFEIEQLNRQKEVLELEKKLAKQEANNQRLLILLILTILGMLILWMVKIKKKHDYFKDVSEIDHLTKVLTRKAFEERVNTVLSNTKNTAVFIAIMDLDFFKAVNDNHGHLIGDWVLKNVIYTCKKLVEERMFIGRLGGEEFGIVMHGVDMGTMYQKIEAMRLAIEKLDTSASGANLQVTASFGISNSLESGYDPAMLLTHADLALFKAKNKGRNQTVVYHENMASD